MKGEEKTKNDQKKKRSQIKKLQDSRDRAAQLTNFIISKKKK